MFSSELREHGGGPKKAQSRKMQRNVAYCGIGVSAPSLHIDSTASMICIIIIETDKCLLYCITHIVHALLVRGCGNDIVFFEFQCIA